MPPQDNEIIDFQLIHGDCLEGMRKLPPASIDTIIADPPYFCGFTHNGKKGSFADLSITKPFFEQVFAEFDRLLKPNGEVYVFCDFRTYPFFYPILIEFLTQRNLIVWDKISGPGNHFSFTHEFIMFATKPSPEYNRNKKGQNIWRDKSFASGAKKTNGKKQHPTQKPIELIERILSVSTKKGDRVLDPFAGSFTTAVACQRMNRNFIGFEQQEKYVAIGRERLEQ